MRKWYPYKGINESYQRWCDKIGISLEDMDMQEKQRIDEIARGVLPKTERLEKMKRGKKSIHAKNPILLIAGGPSLYNWEKIRAFPGKIGIVEVVMERVIRDAMVIPDYIFTLEVQIRPHFLPRAYLTANKDKMFLVMSSISHISVERQAEAVGIPYTRFHHKEEPRISNVGLFSIVYSKEVLECDKIYLLGFEHVGDEWDKREYERWQYDFWHWIQKWEKELIVNCCGRDGGALYYEDYILDADTDSLVIENDN